MNEVKPCFLCAYTLLFLFFSFWGVLNATAKQIPKQSHYVETSSYSTEKEASATLLDSLNQAGKRTIKGRVTSSEDNSPLPGAVIKSKKTGNLTISDLDGYYTLTLNEEEDVLLISFLGMKNKEVKIGKQLTVNVELEPNVELLSEIVVTGYQTLSKERATGSFVVVTNKDIKNKTETNLLSRLEGSVPGFSTYGYSDRPRVVLRGITTSTRDRPESVTEPLYVVDGLPYDGDITLIQPEDVVSVTVLKDAAAASIYGAKAANGVVVITTRQGEEGKMKVSYNGNIYLSPTPSLKHRNLMNSAELVDYKAEVFNYVTPERNFSFKNYFMNSTDDRVAMDPVYMLLIANEKGEISDTELQNGLNVYRNRDNRKQIYKEFSRLAVTHRHNLTFSGGSDKYKYLISANYSENKSNDIFDSSKKYGFASKNMFNITSNITGYLNVNADFSNARNRNGGSTFYSSLFSYPSYYMLRDEEGNQLPFNDKSDSELQRLIDIGLMDESFYPIRDAGKEIWKRERNYFRIQTGVDWKINNDLMASVKYQTEFGSIKEQTYYLQESHKMRANINDAAQVDQTTGEITYNVPLGGRLDQTRTDSKSYTIRGQLSYNKSINDFHTINAIAGAEQRAQKYYKTGNVLLGYDENGMGFSFYDPMTFRRINGTEAIDHYYSDYELLRKISINEGEDRYVSFYGNASYSFDNRYIVSGSIRVDQSNLFGTDPKYQYKPLWSVGANWNVNNENFMKNATWVNRLSLRLTYGIGGNVDAGSTPFVLIYAMGTDRTTGGSYSYIRTPPNPKLRWEKTATTNFGVDASLFNSKITASVDIYNKLTTDLLADRKGDPTLGWSEVKVNYGKMYNRGIECSLRTTNIENQNFAWMTRFTYSYNKNKLVNIEDTQQTVDRYLYTKVLATGKAINSLYSTRYAGIDSQGELLVKNAEGEAVSPNKISSLDDLVYSGSMVPKHTASFTNIFSVNNFTLSARFMFYGGHVIRNPENQNLSGFESTNINRSAIKRWRKKGDERRPGTTPGINPLRNSFISLAWTACDIGVKKADFLKLRDVNLSYRMPRKWLKGLGIESLTLQAQIDEVWWWARNGKIDPEALFENTPYRLLSRKPTTYSFGININF